MTWGAFDLTSEAGVLPGSKVPRVEAQLDVRSRLVKSDLPTSISIRPWSEPDAV
jgi:hypothetical protein